MIRWSKTWDWVRGIVLVLAIVGLAALAWQGGDKLLRHQPLGIDFLPMWAAAHEAFIHPSRVYNFVALTQFQQPLLLPFRGLRPFVYPPTALLAFAPFGFLSFSVANALWTAMGLVLIVWTMAGKVKSPRVLILAAMVISPASFLVLVTGQVTFLIAALVVSALLSMKARPLLAGVLFGVAGVIKPQSLVLLPVALVAAGQWRTIAATAVTAALAVLASVAMFGLDAWQAWLMATPKFEHWVMHTPGLERGMITPTALAWSMHLDPGATLVWRAAFVIGALAICWTVFRKTEDPARRLAALCGGSLFITPYAMHYDAALLAPAAALMLTHRSSPRAWIAALAAAALLCCAAIPQWGAAGVIFFILIVALTPETALMGPLPESDFAPKLPREALG